MAVGNCEVILHLSTETFYRALDKHNKVTHKKRENKDITHKKRENKDMYDKRKLEK